MINFDIRACYKMAMGGYRIRFERSGALATFLKRGKYWRFARIEREVRIR